MSIYRKKNNQLIKLTNYVVQKYFDKYIVCTRRIESGVEYYDVPSTAIEVFSTFSANTIYKFKLPANTTTTPKLRYGQQVLDIELEVGSLQVGQLEGIQELYTKDVNETSKIYWKQVVTSLTGYATEQYARNLVKVTDENHIIQTTDWTVIGDNSVEPFLYQTTVNTQYDVGNNTEVEILNNNPVLFVKAGFSIISINNSVVTIYSFMQPNNNVTLTLRFKELVTQ